MNEERDEVNKVKLQMKDIILKQRDDGLRMIWKFLVMFGIIWLAFGVKLFAKF